MTAAPSRDETVGVFGPAALRWGLFYGHDPALRFELSEGGGYIEMFTRAYDRAREITAAAFEGTERLTVVLAQECHGEPGERAAAVRSLRSCGIRLPSPRARWTEQGDDEDFSSAYLAFHCGPEMINRLLWGALAVEIGIRPRLTCRVYLADVERGILVHPYDDRGMDIIGPNHALLHDLYSRFNAWLLDYDRERMDGFFGG